MPQKKQSHKTTKPIKVKLGKGGKTIQGLNQDQEAFCQYFALGDKEFFGNGVQSYIEVYQPDQTQKNRYKTACSSASQLLSNIKVYTRINELLEEGGLNDQNADKQLTALMNQRDDKGVKLGALNLYTKLKARIIEKPPVTFTYDLTGKSMKEIEELRKELLK